MTEIATSIPKITVSCLQDAKKELLVSKNQNNNTTKEFSESVPQQTGKAAWWFEPASEYPMH